MHGYFDVDYLKILPIVAQIAIAKCNGVTCWPNFGQHFSRYCQVGHNLSIACPLSHQMRMITERKRSNLSD